MIDERVAMAILKCVEDHRGSVNYRQIRTALKATFSNELVIWNEVQELINVEKALGNGGVNPGNRDDLTVMLRPLGRDMLRSYKLESLAFDGPKDGSVPQKQKPKPKIMEW